MRVLALLSLQRPLTMILTPIPFDTSSVDSVVEAALKANQDALVVIIKSTLPVGHTRSLQKQHGTERVIFSPEFLREGQGS